MYQEAFPSNSKLWKVQTLWWIRNKRDVDKEEVADTMNQENHRPLVTDEPVEFWEMSTGWSSRLQKNHFRGIFRMSLKVITIYWKITRSQPDENWLDLETLGFWPIMPKNLPQHSTDRYIFLPSLACIVTHTTVFLLSTLGQSGGQGWIWQAIITDGNTNYVPDRQWLPRPNGCCTEEMTLHCIGCLQLASYSHKKKRGESMLTCSSDRGDFWAP